MVGVVRGTRPDLACATVAFAVALAVRMVVLRSPPYGDEPLFWFGAAHPFAAPAGVTDLAGRPFEPRGLFFERPAFFALLWLPAQAGFGTFRMACAVLGALLAPGAYAVVRSRAGRPASLAAGLGVALVPDLAAWTSFGLTDALMTLWLLAVCWARLQGRSRLAAAFAVLAVWTKETAFLVPCVLLAADLVRGWRGGDVTVRPFRLATRRVAMLWPVAMGLVPLLLAFAMGFPHPGVRSPGSGAALADMLFVSPWLIPVLAIGLVPKGSRRLAAWGLAVGGGLLALHVAAGLAVQAWYAVPAQVFALVGVAASVDALARFGWASGKPGARAAAGALAVVAALIVFAAIASPAGAVRNAIHPWAADAGHDLVGRLRFETSVRDQDRVAAFAALPTSGFDLVTLGLDFPQHISLLTRAGHQWVLTWPTHTPGEFTAAQVAARIETNSTWTLVALQGTSAQEAVLATYGDCAVFRDGGFALLQGWRCPGRAGALASASNGVGW